MKNTVVVPPGGIDRSPCGTGTSAKLAVLYAQKEIEIGEEFIHESIVGSLFKGYVMNTTHVENIEAVITKITDQLGLWVCIDFYNEMDPLKEGFLLIPPMEHETEDIK